MLTIEATRNGTITRANARTLNSALRKAGWDIALTGTHAVDSLQAFLDDNGIAYRTVDAAALTGADKARHTRAVTRSHNAQVARAARKATTTDALAA